MNLSNLIDKKILLRKKLFTGPNPHSDVVATVIAVLPVSVKCRLNSGVIYIPKKFFSDYTYDSLNRILSLPNWFSYMTKEELDQKVKEGIAYANEKTKSTA